MTDPFLKQCLLRQNNFLHASFRNRVIKRADRADL